MSTHAICGKLRRCHVREEVTAICLALRNSLPEEAGDTWEMPEQPHLQVVVQWEHQEREHPGSSSNQQTAPAGTRLGGKIKQAKETKQWNLHRISRIGKLMGVCYISFIKLNPYRLWPGNLKCWLTSTAQNRQFLRLCRQLIPKWALKWDVCHGLWKPSVFTLHVSYRCRVLSIAFTEQIYFHFGFLKVKMFLMLFILRVW